MYAGVTCNVDYNDVSFANNIIVDNFVNSEPLSVSNTDIKRMSDVGTNQAPDDF